MRQGRPCGSSGGVEAAPDHGRRTAPKRAGWRMITLYLNHFRGFEETFIPLADVSFLVGENSTGKTSVLTALRVLCGHAVWLLGNFQSGDEVLGGFNDFASNGVGWFQIGYFRHEPAEEGEYDAILLTFTGQGSQVPWVMDVWLRASHTEARFLVDYDEDSRRLFFEKQAVTEDTETAFRAWTRRNPLSGEGLDLVDSEHLHEYAPVGMLMALYEHETALYELEVVSFEKQFEDNLQAARSGLQTSTLSRPTRPDFPQASSRKMSWTDDLQWLAPIRAKPRRSYDSVAQAYSPEGDHIPWRLRGLSDRSKLRERIRDYGVRSGLYEDVETRKFGDTEDAPFELRVRLGERTPNVINVGYGISQVLPVVTSLLEPSLRGAWFALQQPEVHLHPRAQAALGEVLFEMALPPHSKRFLVETHSDYVVDRFRYRMRKAAETGEKALNAQVLFFERAGDKNIVHRLPLEPNGDYPEAQPDGFRAFFLQEELKNLGY